MQCRLQATLIAITAAATAVSLIGGRWLGDQWLHHLPTAVVLALLGVAAKRGSIPSGAAIACHVFLLLHVTAARWVYSNVPYDDWWRALFGVSLSERFGWRRNHFDRLVHFTYGACATIVQADWLERRGVLRFRNRHGLSLLLVLAAGALYEMVEWQVALLAAPDRAERYNGQQGDAFDARKDQAMALLGALLVTAIASVARSGSMAAAARRGQNARPSSEARAAPDTGRRRGGSRD